jgi:hypothetical protein
MAHPSDEESISTLATTKVQDPRFCLVVAFEEGHELPEWRATHIPRRLVLFLVVSHSSTSAGFRLYVLQLASPMPPSYSAGRKPAQNLLKTV